MATLKCIACGADNKPGEQWCTTCSSSLNLKLCSACEAINGHAAEKCHGCGAQFANEASAPSEKPAVERAPTIEAPAVEATVEVATVEDAPARRSFPARRYVEAPPRRSTVAQAALLWTVAVLLGMGGAYGYHRYQLSGWPAVSGLISPKVPASPGPTAAPAPAPSSLPEPEAPEARPAVTARAAPSAPKPAKAAVAPATPVAPKTVKSSVTTQATPRVEPKRSAAPVTHTRAGSAAVEAAAPASASVAAPVAATAAPATAAPATVSRSRVTHTKAPEPGEAAAVAVSVPAAATQPPIEKPINPNPSTCTPAVAALGLCISK